MPNFSVLFKSALRGQLAMLKVTAITLIPAYLFAAVAAISFLTDVVLFVLNLADVVQVATGNLVTLLVLSIACGIITAILAAITLVQFSRHGGEVMESMMEGMMEEMGGSDRLRPTRPTMRRR